MKTFEDFENELNRLINNPDTESAHIQADDILCEICKSRLNREKRQKLVALYEEVDKWYA